MTFISRRDLLKRAAAVGAALPAVGTPFQASDDGARAFQASESVAGRSAESLALRRRSFRKRPRSREGARAFQASVST
jgi:hypothetical protein